MAVGGRRPGVMQPGSREITDNESGHTDSCLPTLDFYIRSSRDDSRVFSLFQVPQVTFLRL